VLYRAAADALRLLNEAAAGLRERGAPASVTVSCSIGFASLWLVPRLADFRDAHPDVDIRIAADNRLLDIDRERIELAIRYCPPDLAPAGATRLFGDEVFPVCSPALVQRATRPLLAPEDLRSHVLLHFEDAERLLPAGSWTLWLEILNQRNLKPAGSLHFSHYDQLIQAAIDGQGVALGISPLVRRHLQQGRLVAPFEQRFASPRGYYLAVAKHGAARPEVRAFIDWLEGAARREA
jgi:LysR family transcriptional regulator, glycine cleavage system transcriptional activator